MERTPPPSRVTRLHMLSLAATVQRNRLVSAAHPLDPPTRLLTRTPGEEGLWVHREPAPHGEPGG